MAVDKKYDSHGTERKSTTMLQSLAAELLLS